MVTELTLKAPAKINLCLAVLGKRTDGYHEVEMLMQMVGLFDEVHVSRTGTGISVECDAPGVPSGEKNIAYRAAAEMLKLSGGAHGLKIGITKRIPVAAGLGGGSSDAAAVLAAADRLFGLGLGPDRLSGIGARLGMDVPFFFHGPTAVARGRGEVLTPLPPLPKLRLLLVNPGFETSTSWVYNNLRLGLTKKAGCNKIHRLTIRNIAENLRNDLETVTQAAHPVIAEIKHELLASGAQGALMSGSGPTVYGIFDSEDGRQKATERLDRRGWLLYPADTLTEPPNTTG